MQKYVTNYTNPEQFVKQQARKFMRCHMLLFSLVQASLARVLPDTATQMCLGAFLLLQVAAYCCVAWYTGVYSVFFYIFVFSIVLFENADAWYHGVNKNNNGYVKLE